MEPSGTVTVSSLPFTASKPMRLDRDAWAVIGIVGLALFLRLVLPGLKPPHFDEGVNGWFCDQMTKEGYYHYDPSNFHGPLHFYLLFISQQLFGRHIWALRLPVALISTGCVAMVFAFRRYFGARACEMAALAMAVSPGMVFYGRYAIHESELVFFLLLAVWGGAGLFYREPGAEGAPAAKSRSHLWALGLGVTGTILTKETFAIHLIAFGLAFPALWLLERFSPSTPGRYRKPDWDWIGEESQIVGAVCFAIIVFFYSGGFLDWSSLRGLFTAFWYWGATGMNRQSGHEKEHWYYWFELLWRYEWAGLAGMLGIIWLAWPNRNRLLRYLTIAGSGTLVGYTIIAYKTPWCIISMLWPYLFLFGAVTIWLNDHLFAADDGEDDGFFTRPAWLVSAAAGVLLMASCAWSMRLNFQHFTDEEEKYVYVQTTADIHRLLDPLHWLTSWDPVYYHIPGHILIHIEESHPLPWLLGDFTDVDYLEDTHPPADMNADFLLVDDSIVSDTEEKLTDTYFKESFLLRGSSEQVVMLYLKASVFGPYFPGRTPEFTPLPIAPEKTEEVK